MFDPVLGFEPGVQLATDLPPIIGAVGQPAQPGGRSGGVPGGEQQVVAHRPDRLEVAAAGRGHDR